MTKFFFKFKNPIFGHFWPISPIFGAKKVFPQNRVVMQFPKGFWHHAKIQKNLMIKFQEKTQRDVRRQGWTDPIS